MERKEFIAKYTEIISLAAQLGEVARRESIFGLMDKLDKIPAENDRDILKYGLVFVVDGTAFEIIDKILTNLVEQEKDADKRLLKTMQREAVLMIQQGYNPRIMLSILNSFTDISLSEHKAIIGNIDDKLVKNEKREMAEEEENSKTISILQELVLGGNVSDENIQAALRELDMKDLMIALKIEPRKVREVFFRNMTERAADILKEDMEFMGQVRMQDVLEAQNKILPLLMMGGGNNNNDDDGLPQDQIDKLLLGV